MATNSFPSEKRLPSGRRNGVVHACIPRSSVRAALIAPVQHASEDSGSRDAAYLEENLAHLMRTSRDFIQALTLSPAILPSSPAHALLPGWLSSGSVPGAVNTTAPETASTEQRSDTDAVNGSQGTAPPVAEASSSTTQPVAAGQASTATQAVQQWVAPVGGPTAAAAELMHMAPAAVGAAAAAEATVARTTAATHTAVAPAATYTSLSPPPVATATRAAWHSPAQLPARQLVTCVYALAKAGHVPTAAWMHECLAATEHVLLQQAVEVSRVQPAAVTRTHRHTTQHSNQAAVSTSHGSQGFVLPGQPALAPHHHDVQLCEGELFTLTWGIARFYQLQRRQQQQRQQQHCQGPGTPHPSPGPSHASRFSLVMSSLAPAAATKPPDTDTMWQPSQSWLCALEHASLVIACGVSAPTGTSSLQSLPVGSISQHSSSRLPGHRQQRQAAGTPRLFSAIPWCMAAMGLTPSPTWLVTWTGALQPVMRELTGQDVAQLAWALARLRYRPPEAWMRSLVGRAEQLAVERQLVPQDLANTMWACATMGYSFGSSFVAEALHPRVLGCPRLVKRFTARDVAHIMWALARTQQRPSVATLHSLMTLAAHHAKQMNEQDLTQTVWALATLRYSPAPALRKRIVHALSWKLAARGFTPKGLPTLLWALSRLPWRVPHLLSDRLLDVAASMARQLGVLGISMVLYFATKQPRPLAAKHAHALMKASVVHQAVSEPHNVLPAGVGAQQAVPVTAAVGGHVPGARGSLLLVPSVWSKCSCRTAGMALWSLARCHVRPNRAWMLQFLAGTWQTLPRAGPADLCTLVCALSALSYRPPRAWRDQLALRAHQVHAQGQLQPAHQARLAMYLEAAPAGRQSEE